MLSAIMSLMLLGQCEPQVIYSQPDIVYIYRLGTMVEQTRFDSPVSYSDGLWRTVPVINGFVPAITFQNTLTERRIILDYTCGFSYEKNRGFVEQRRLSSNEISQPPARNNLLPIPDPWLSKPSSIGNPRVHMSPTYKDR